MHRTIVRTHLTPDEISARVPKDILEETLFDWVPVEKMFVPKYGRALSQPKIDGLRRNWDPRAVGVLMLSFRANDTYAIIDGQHRMAAAQLEGITALPARIYIDLAYEEEAALYRRFATVHQQTALDIFRARVEERDPLALQIVAVLKKYKMDIAAVPGPNRLTAIAAVNSIVSQYGLDFFDEVLGLLREAWTGNSRAWAGPMLQGMAMFWYRYRAVVDRKRLVAKLVASTPDTVTRMGTQLASLLGSEYGSAKIGIAIRHLYNAGIRKNQLAEWQPKIMTDEGRIALREGQERARKTNADRRRDAILSFLDSVLEADTTTIVQRINGGDSTVRATLKQLSDEGLVIRRTASTPVGGLVYLYRLDWPNKGEADARN